MVGSRRSAIPTRSSRMSPWWRGALPRPPIWSTSQPAAVHVLGSRPDRIRTMSGRRSTAAISTSWPATRNCRKKTTRRASPGESVPSTRRTARSSRAYVGGLSGVPNRSTRNPCELGGTAAMARWRACCRETRLPPTIETAVANASPTPTTTRTGRRGFDLSLAAETPNAARAVLPRTTVELTLVSRVRGRGCTAGRSWDRTASRPGRARRS